MTHAKENSLCNGIVACKPIESVASCGCVLWAETRNVSKQPALAPVREAQIIVKYWILSTKIRIFVTPSSLVDLKRAKVESVERGEHETASYC